MMPQLHRLIGGLLDVKPGRWLQQTSSARFRADSAQLRPAMACVEDFCGMGAASITSAASCIPYRLARIIDELKVRTVNKLHPELLKSERTIGYIKDGEQTRVLLDAVLVDQEGDYEGCYSADPRSTFCRVRQRAQPDRPF